MTMTGYPDGEAMVAQQAKAREKHQRRIAAIDRKRRMFRSRWVRENPKLSEALREAIESGLDEWKIREAYRIMYTVVHGERQ